MAMITILKMIMKTTNYYFGFSCFNNAFNMTVLFYHRKVEEPLFRSKPHLKTKVLVQINFLLR